MIAMAFTEEHKCGDCTTPVSRLRPAHRLQEARLNMCHLMMSKWEMSSRLHGKPSYTLNPRNMLSRCHLSIANCCCHVFAAPVAAAGELMLTMWHFLFSATLATKLACPISGFSRTNACVCIPHCGLARSHNRPETHTPRCARMWSKPCAL